MRTAITVSGLPYRWTTNLSDDNLREFFRTYREQLTGPLSSNADSKVIRIPLRLNIFEFREGLCLWVATDDEHKVLYRSSADWEIWESRYSEVAELRDEQTAEVAVTRRVLSTEDDHLHARTEEAILDGDYHAADGWITARAELRNTIDGDERWKMPIYWDHWSPELVYARFPTSQLGIEFFKRFDHRPRAYSDFAHWFADRCGLDVEALITETGKIHAEALRLFPEDGGVAKAACLFYRRMGRYDKAIRLCADAVGRGLVDGTKSGFKGRLLRLARESGRCT